MTFFWYFSQILGDVEIEKNSNEAGRSAGDVLDVLSQFIQRNDVSVHLPIAESKVTISSRNLDNDEVDFKIKFNDATAPSESRKSKLKKIAIPILTFVLLKAITLVPLGLGILGIKAFNALQLSFFSFVISVGLAVFQLCRKVNSLFINPSDPQFYLSFSLLLSQLSLDHQHPQIAAAGPWDTRNLNEVLEYNAPAQDIAYNAYA